MDIDHCTYVDGKRIEIPNIDKLCLAIKTKFLNQEKENNRLKELNSQLKSGIYEKKELARLSEENIRIKADAARGFRITEEELQAIQEWRSKHIETRHNSMHSGGAIGGQFTYSFTPTSIGTIGKIQCNSCMGKAKGDPEWIDLYDAEFVFRELE